MNENVINIILDGSPEDGGDVRFSELLDALQKVKNALQNRERLLTGKSTSQVYYRVTKVTHNSPLQLQLEAYPNEVGGDFSGPVVRSFFNDLKLIQTKKKLPDQMDMPTILSYGEMSPSARSHIQEIVLIHGKDEFKIDRNFSERIQSVIGPDIIELGSVAGRLEMISTHRTRKFYIYPLIGASRISCTFPQQMLNEVKNCLDKRVTVSGKVRTKEWDKFPHAVEVSEIIEFPDDSTLAKFSDLIGADPNAGGGLSLEEYSEKLRNEWK